jgi:hypothetical protein
MRSANWLAFWALWCLAWVVVELIHGDHVSAAWAFTAGIAFFGWSQETSELNSLRDHAERVYVVNVALRSELNRRNQS